MVAFRNVEGCDHGPLDSHVPNINIGNNNGWLAHTNSPGPYSSAFVLIPTKVSWVSNTPSKSHLHLSPIVIMIGSKMVLFCTS